MRSVLTVIATLAVLAVAMALFLPAYGDYTPRMRIAAAVTFMSKAKSGLESSCSDGTFASKQKLADIGLPEVDLSAYVYRAEFRRVSTSAATLRTTLTAIYGSP